MGQMVCRSVAEARSALVAAIDRSRVIDRRLIGRSTSDHRGARPALRAEVRRMDFCTPVVMDNIRWCVTHAVHLVVGTTGLSADDLLAIRKLIEAEGGDSNVVVAPNFAIGAVLMQRFAAQAARYFSAVEIVELHHDAKADAPSGTAMATVDRLLEERAEAYRGPMDESLRVSVAVRQGSGHSVRLPGLLAHQEVIWGGDHDPPRSTDRARSCPAC
jgi:4-hydroxy-tetrahydrodipicolinate reductase